MPSPVKSSHQTSRDKKLLAELSVPSKTFLLGEYLILLEGPALIVATKPRFRLKIYESEKTSHVFHPKSPAGQLLKDQNIRNRFFEFLDPYSGTGGMGASSAQFILVESFLNSFQNLDWQKLYQKFRSQSLNQEAWDRPSGGDVVTQLTGGLTSFNPKKGELKKYAWPFADLDFSLLKTSQKLATHEHLKSIKSVLFQFQKSELFVTATQSVSQAVTSLEKETSDLFVESFKNFANVLDELGLISDLTRRILTEMKACPEILAAKGCGAMGADVICVLHRPGNLAQIQALVAKLGLKYLGSCSQIDSIGLKFDSSSLPSV